MATLLCHQGLGQQLRSWGCSCWGSLGVCTPSPNSQPYSVGPTTSLLPLCSFPYSSNWMQLGPAKRTGIRLSTAGFFLCSRVAKTPPTHALGDSVNCCLQKLSVRASCVYSFCYLGTGMKAATANKT